MRCLSPFAKYSLQVIEGNEQVVLDARGFASRHTLAKPVIANFFQQGLLDHEIDLALSTFPFSGLAEGVNPLTRIGVFDTEAYVMRYPKNERSALLVQINQRLRELQQDNPNDFIIADPPQSPRPWPSYDEDSVEEILAFQERLRVSPTEIRLYEEQNKQRKSLVVAMLKLEDPDAAERVEAGVEDNEIPAVEDEVIEVAS